MKYRKSNDRPPVLAFWKHVRGAPCVCVYVCVCTVYMHFTVEDKAGGEKSREVPRIG